MSSERDANLRGASKWLACGRRRGSFSHAPGFSLIELMITLAVLSVLLGLAVPSFSSTVRSTRLATTTNDFLGALFLTRSEAIKRGKRVTMCTSVDSISCAANVGWHRGWIMFEDTNGNALREAGEAILRVEVDRPGQIRITGTSTMRDYISYIPTGSTRAASGALQMATITICESGVGRQIVINVAGRPRVVGRVGC